MRVSEKDVLEKLGALQCCIRKYREWALVPGSAGGKKKMR
jgi:hypothetical protein